MTNLMKYSRLCLVVGISAMLAIVLLACASQPAAQPQAQTSNPGSNPGLAENSDNPITAVPPASNSAAQAAGQSGGTNGGVSFSKDIMPIFQNTCVNCHGGEKTSKGLDMKTFASLMAGSQNGAILVPGDAANSKIIQSVESGKMPKRGPKLTQDQIQLLVDWINSGAQNN